MSGLLGSYAALVTRYPYAGNMVQSAVLFATGDVLAQQAVEKKGWKHNDWARTGRMVIWGGGIFAPYATTWFKFLEGLPIKGKVATTVTRVALDQLVAAPVVLSAFFTAMTFMEGGTWGQAKDKLRTSFWPTLKTNWTLFVPFQFINMLIPLQYRVLAVNAINIPWNAYLSLQNAKANRVEAEGPIDVEMAVKQA